MADLGLESVPDLGARKGIPEQLDAPSPEPCTERRWGGFPVKSGGKRGPIGRGSGVGPNNQHIPPLIGSLCSGYITPAFVRVSERGESINTLDVLRRNNQPGGSDPRNPA